MSSDSTNPRAWHPDEAGKPVGAVSSKKRKIFFVLAAMLALVGVIAAWLFYLSPFKPPTFLTVAITEYKSRNIPVNAFALRDSDALHDRLGGGNAHDNQTRRLLEQRLESVANDKDKRLVIHLCGYARTDDQGRLYLLPADARLDDPGTWLPMRQVLQIFKDSKAKEQLLILDIMGSLDDPRLGTLPDDIAGRFKELFEAEKRGNLLVLCACSPGQVSLVSEELAQSVFGYYLHEGLRGFADGYNSTSKRDGRVSAKELAAFVTARVDRWALRNRGVRQTPMFLGEAKDFDLVALERGELAPALKTIKVDVSPLPIRRGWKLRDEWLADGTNLVAFHLVHRLGVLIWHQEHQARGGVDVVKIKQEMDFQVGELKKQLSRLTMPRPEKIYSLFQMADGKVRKVNTSLEKFLTTALGSLRPGGKLDALAKHRMEFEQKFKDTVTLAELGWTIFQVATSDDSPCTAQVHFQFLNDLLQAKRTEPAFVELIPLQRLAGLKVSADQWPRESIRRMFLVIREGERALASDAREIPWVRHLLDAGEQTRLQAESLLFAGDPEEFQQLNDLLDKALRQFRDASNYLTVVHDAHAMRDEALRLLPSYLAYLVAPSELVDVSGVQRTWLQATRETRELDRILMYPPDKAPPLDALDQQMNALRRRTARLREYLDSANLRKPLKLVDPRLVAAEDEPGEDDAALRRLIVGQHQLEAILNTSWPTTGERLSLWKNQRRFASLLHQKSRDLDQADNRADKQTRVSRDLGEKSSAQRDLDPALQRVNLSLALLTLAGLPDKDVKNLEEFRQRAITAKSGLKAWNNLAAALRKAWFEQLPNRLRLALKIGDLASADRVIRLLHPLNWEGTNPLDDRANPAAQLRQQQLGQNWKWLAQRYAQRAQALTKQPIFRDYYQQAARDYLGAAQ